MPSLVWMPASVSSATRAKLERLLVPSPGEGQGTGSPLISSFPISLPYVEETVSRVTTTASSSSSIFTDRS